MEQPSLHSQNNFIDEERPLADWGNTSVPKWWCNAQEKKAKRLTFGSIAPLGSESLGLFTCMKKGAIFYERPRMLEFIPEKSPPPLLRYNTSYAPLNIASGPPPPFVSICIEQL